MFLNIVLTVVFSVALIASVIFWVRGEEAADNIGYLEATLHLRRAYQYLVVAVLTALAYQRFS